MAESQSFAKTDLFTTEWTRGAMAPRYFRPAAFGPGRPIKPIAQRMIDLGV